MTDLARIAREARAAYVRRVAGGATGGPWWTAVLITASSARQAARYDDEIRRRLLEGKLPAGVLFRSVPDPGDRRIGSGGATLNALRALSGSHSLDWWIRQRVLVLHSGGDSRRLPQYSLSGKLFSALPVKTAWGDTSTVFDEFLALSTAWAERMESGLLAASGDVLLTFDAAGVAWNRPGVCGVAIRQPAAVGSQHGVYIADDNGRVYAFLQKASAAEVRAAGGMLPGEQVALDSGLLRFDAITAARLGELAREAGEALPFLDLYQHVTLALTGRPPAWLPLAAALEHVPFRCSVVEGDFTHVGTTRHFRRLFAEARAAGVALDSVLAGGAELGPGAVAIECDLAVPVRAGAGAILHGLEGLREAIEVPPDTVVHQVRLVLEDGRRAAMIRVYGVEDDPKATGAAATWFGRPIGEELGALGVDAEAVWPGVDEEARSLWNARLFPAAAAEEAWGCARWLLRLDESWNAARWREARRLSLEESAGFADPAALAASHARRRQGAWRMAAVELARAGADIRPLMTHAPGVAPAAEAGRALAAEAGSLVTAAPSEAASRCWQASLLLGCAGLAEEAAAARAGAFAAVRCAVDAGVYEDAFAGAAREWRHAAVAVFAPPRVDFGGGWSDTPPFCLDWGGTVVNMAVEFGEQYPIRTVIRRLARPVVRCHSEGGTAEYCAMEEVLAPPEPGSPFSIPRVALALAGVARPDVPLARALERLGGGIEIRTAVDLPMGSGLGTSSILAATLLRALGEMLGCPLSDAALCDQVMRLEQRMTTGGGWQDQVGGIYPGAKLAISGPGLRQRVRVEPVAWSEEREAEFCSRFVLYYTGIRRMARDLLAQVVGSYLAREVAVVQVLHSIKTLALEMTYALRAGEWDYLGSLLDRHWEQNQVLDPHTTNAPISALLREVRPFVAGAKLAGAGGGGFLMLLAKGPGEAEALRAHLAARQDLPGAALYGYRLARAGLRVSHDAAALAARF